MAGFNNNQNFEFNPSQGGYYNNAAPGGSGFYGNNNDPSPQQMFQQGFGNDNSNGMMMDPSGAGSYFPQQQHQHQHQHQHQQPYGGGYSQEGWEQQWNHPTAPTTTTTTTTEQQIQDGSYYFNSEFTPQISGYPVSSLAYDTSYEALYVASTTQSMSTTRWKSHNASMLVTHSNLDGMLYSSVAGHPEATSSTLQSVYNCLYGIRKTIALPPGARQNIPPHAYKPPFGEGNDGDPSITLQGGGGGRRGHIGISSILPLGGYAATISPSGVRIHATGGLQLHDLDIEGMLCGTIHPHSDVGGAATHISVGGISIGPKWNGNQIHCIDLWQGLRIVSSRTFKDTFNKNIGVSAVASSHERSTIVAGCSDGYLRMLDGSLREVATVRSHAGGISSMAVSPDGMLVATTGYSSRSRLKEAPSLYTFPDPFVYIYDLRYLGRGGIAHPFAGVGGMPHHVSFIPDMKNFPSNRLLVASGKPGGGLQVLSPFEAQNENSTSFFQPQLEQSESISAMTQSEEDVVIGTNLGRILNYKLAGYQPTVSKSNTTQTGMYSGSSSYNVNPKFGGLLNAQSNFNRNNKKKKPLKMPPFLPPNAPVSLAPTLLAGGSDPNRRNGGDDRIKSLFSTVVLQSDPKISFIGNSVEESMATFGTLAAVPIVANNQRKVAASFLSDTAPGETDYLLTLPASKLDVDILSNHNKISKRYLGKKGSDVKLNPNKFLYCDKLSSLCYEDGLNGRRRQRIHRGGSGSCGDSSEEIPARYRLKLRPSFKTAGAFDPSEYNNSGLFPGWDYTPTMPNAFASPVLLLLYFVPEVLSATLSAQYDDTLFSAKGYEKALSPELGFVFHHIDCLSSYAWIQQPKSRPDNRRIGAFHPSNFLTALANLPEAEQLQILDGSPAAVDHPRRPEAFYRFLAYQLDRELSKNSGIKIMDSSQGLDFISINQFITRSSPASHCTTRALTVDLFYDTFSADSGPKDYVRFGELLQRSLCRETRLRAWNHTSKAYETIIQRKIATSLPKILALSCACAGRKDEDGLFVWRADGCDTPFLPEMIEIELDDEGNVVVREMPGVGDEASWNEFKGKSPLPDSVAKLVSETSSPARHRYRLDAVVSYVVDDGTEAAVDDYHSGHHILHARVPYEYKVRALKRQQQESEKRAALDLDPTKFVLTADVDPDVFRKRSESAGKLLAASSRGDSDWILYNGFQVSKTVVEDATAFHVNFKEPCLVIFRSVDDANIESSEDNGNFNSPRIPVQVMNARSLGSNANKASIPFNPKSVAEGKLVAFDAEFVSVQEEEASINESGAKVLLRETRHAVARISVIDCDTRKVIVDDHVLPRERVVDYLTRFSGIVAEDLDPLKSRHNLISSRSAYLKLRYLIEQGCIFVGHGMKQDFMTLNLIVPPHQILDTVELYHFPGERYISLRFLSNYVLGKDMQQDIHDSVEDAMAAFELYGMALQWKFEGVFEKKLQELYAFGAKTDWKFALDRQ